MLISSSEEIYVKIRGWGFNTQNNGPELW